MPFRSRRFVLRSLIVLLLVLASAAPVRPASALLNSDPMAIISAVNARCALLRACRRTRSIRG